MKRKDVVGKFVEIEWKRPEDDWPFFQVVDLSKHGKWIRLRGMDYPDGTGKHTGGVFWSKTKRIKMLKVCVLNAPGTAT